MTNSPHDEPPFTEPTGLSPGGRALWAALVGAVADGLKPASADTETAADMPVNGSNDETRHK